MSANMPASTAGPAANPQRPTHQRNPSSKSAILRALLGTEPLFTKTETDKDVDSHFGIPVLGERSANSQTPPTSPRCQNSKQKPTNQPYDLRVRPTRTRPPVIDTAAAACHNSHNNEDCVGKTPKDDKENTTPPHTGGMQSEPPIWAQFARARETSLQEEIARYTPSDYRPDRQRNFNGTLDSPALRPTLGRDSRPSSSHLLISEGFVGALTRRVSSGRPSFESRMSEDSDRRKIHPSRTTSGSSHEQPPPKEKLNIAKRGGRVMAAVAAFQGKSKPVPVPVTRPEPTLDPKEVDTAFEAVLQARNIPEPQRQKMRALTLRVKADFVRQDKGCASADLASPTILNKTEASGHGNPADSSNAAANAKETSNEEDKMTKRSRARSRTFTFSKSDKSTDRSPSKKARALSRAGLGSLVTSKESTKSTALSSAPATPNGSLGRRSAPPAYPADYISYLRAIHDPTKAEVGKLHKLRLLLRNETVSWVQSFISLGGMTAIVELLNQIMAIEWREEHEDQLLHETLLCLKALCTTELAMSELDNHADALFPKLFGMLFDDEKKGPAEYTTRTVIVNVLFNFLASATTRLSPCDLDRHARRILTYLGEQGKADDARPVDFVLEMRTPRPYKLWCREVSNVSKEVFWIFLHNVNVVPSPKVSSGTAMPENGSHHRTGSTASLAPYAAKHFPRERPPVPAAPYIGGVEWDATTYLAAHLDLMNGLLASIESRSARNALRTELRASGFEKLLGGTLRTCKEKFYSCVHDGLREWVAAAMDDGWETKAVREGPNDEESLSKSPSKKKADTTPSPKLDVLPVLQSPKLGLGDDDGWLG